MEPKGDAAKGGPPPSKLRIFELPLSLGFGPHLLSLPLSQKGQGCIEWTELAKEEPSLLGSLQLKFDWTTFFSSLTSTKD